MKIVYLSSSAIPSLTANSIQVMKMCHALSKVGNEVLLCTPRFQRKRNCAHGNDKDVFKFYNIENNFKICWLSIPNVRGKPIFLIPKITNLLQVVKPDIVYGRFLLGCLASAIIGWPTIFEAHCTAWEINKIEGIAFKMLLNSKGFRGCVFISKRLENLYAKVFPKHIGKFLVAHDAADNPLNFNHFMNGKNNNLTAGYIGSFGQGKGVETVLELAKTKPDIRFIIAGGSESEIEGLKRSISPNVKLYGFVPQRRIADIYKKFEIALLPNRIFMPSYRSKVNIADYNSPLKLFEYMAHSKAIIASDLPNIREVLSEETAILVPPEDIVEWAKALDNFRDPVRRQALKRSAYNKFCNKHTWQKRAEHIIKSFGFT